MQALEWVFPEGAAYLVFFGTTLVIEIFSIMIAPTSLVVVINSYVALLMLFVMIGYPFPLF